MYPLLVACKSASPSRRAAAYSVLEQLRQHSAVLVEQAQLVSQELIRWAGAGRAGGTRRAQCALARRQPHGLAASHGAPAPPPGMRMP
jgi:hypothetical protein